MPQVRRSLQPRVTEHKGLGEPNLLEPGGTRGPGRHSEDAQWAVGDEQTSRRQLVISETHIVESSPAERAPGDSELTSALGPFIE